MARKSAFGELSPAVDKYKFELILILLILILLVSLTNSRN
jgi:hypothetical protein